MRNRKMIFVIVAMFVCLTLILVACDKKIENDTTPQKATYTISFDANGGSGTMNNISTEEGSTASLPVNAFTKEGYNFSGWATTVDGDVVYQDRENIVVNENITLYAKWIRSDLNVTISAAQKTNHGEAVTVSWGDASERISKIEITALRGQTEVAKKTITTASEIAIGTADLDVYWGDYNVKVKAYGVDGITNVETTTNVKVFTDKYRISYMHGTFSVSLFTLQMMDRTSPDIESRSETFVYLCDRPGAYDWDALPSYMKALPVALPGTNSSVALNTTAAWIRELYAMNNESTFALYFNDTHLEVLCALLIDNGIPANKWSAIMYSDGSESARYINETFNDVTAPQTATSKYNEMSTAWNNYINKTINRNALPYSGGTNLPYYACIICNNMNNVFWYTGRMKKDENILLNDATFATFILENMANNGNRIFYLNSLLANIIPDAEEETAFRTLYHIDPNTFQEAAQTNRKIMMILGDKWTGEGADLEDYMRVTMKVYGTTDYVYYYKGHPGYPTSSYPERQEILNRLTVEHYPLYELDNTVAAEFFLFFFDHIEMIGYMSSTFDSTTNKNAAGIYETIESVQEGERPGLVDTLETFISKIEDNDAFNALYAAKGIELLADKTYYMVEFQREMATNRDIAIYETSSKNLTSYKLVNENYEVVI